MALIFLLGALASYRLTRLVVEDSILDRPRDWLTQKAAWIEALLGCYWCAGLWCSGLVAIVIWAWPTESQPFLMVFALSAVVGILSELMDWLTSQQSSNAG